MIGVWKTTILRQGQPDQVRWRAYLDGELGMFATRQAAFAAVGRAACARAR